MRSGAETRPPRWVPLPAAMSELERLLRRKDDLTQLVQQERNRKGLSGLRLHGAKAVDASLNRLIGVGGRAACQRGGDCRVPAPASGHRRRGAAAVQWTGIGAQSVLPILVLLAWWATLTEGQGEAKGLVADAGLDPQPHDSGSRVRKRAKISRMGQPTIRRLLFLGALGGVHGKKALRVFYERLVGRGKAKMVALIAAARKMVVWAWAVYRDHTVFTPEKAAARMAVAA